MVEQGHGKARPSLWLSFAWRHDFTIAGLGERGHDEKETGKFQPLLVVFRILRIISLVSILPKKGLWWKWALGSLLCGLRKNWFVVGELSRWVWDVWRRSPLRWFWTLRLIWEYTIIHPFREEIFLTEGLFFLDSKIQHNMLFRDGTWFPSPSSLWHPLTISKYSNSRQ